jgi:hypothetical protein
LYNLFSEGCAKKLKNDTLIFLLFAEASDAPPHVVANLHGEPSTCALQDAAWASHFTIPWEIMPRTLMDCCSKEQRPTKADMRQLAKVIGDKIWTENKKPGRQNLREIAQKVINKYPRSFQDEVPGVGVLGDGLTSLTNRLAFYVDNKNRQPGNSLKRKVVEATNKRIPSGKIAKDSFGCVRWQPSQLPENESKETQEQHRIWLVNEYPKTAPNLQKVASLMTITYASQRMTINEGNEAGTHLSDILEKWPYLKKPEFLFEHFHELMGFDLMTKLDDALRRKAGDIMNYALEDQNRSSKTKAQELMELATKLEINTPKMAGVVLLLPLLLKDSGNLFQQKEVLFF